jgi:hypothetical protein
VCRLVMGYVVSCEMCCVVLSCVVVYECVYVYVYVCGALHAYAVCVCCYCILFCALTPLS